MLHEPTQTAEHSPAQPGAGALESPRMQTRTPARRPQYAWASSMRTKCLRAALGPGKGASSGPEASAANAPVSTSPDTSCKPQNPLPGPYLAWPRRQRALSCVAAGCNTGQLRTPAHASPHLRRGPPGAALPAQLLRARLGPVARQELRLPAQLRAEAERAHC